MEEVLDSLTAFECRTAAFIGGLSAEALAKVQNSTTSINSLPYDITQAASECDFGVCHGGHGTTCELLLKGKPLLLLPMHLEQYLIARGVVDASAGILVDYKNPHRDFEAAIGQIINNPELVSHAKAFAQRYSSLEPLSTVMRIANECETVVRQHGNTAE
jgi:UDP:flavonoid glycosyltransferase YjiC (YdhE family)